MLRQGQLSQRLRAVVCIQKVWRGYRARVLRHELCRASQREQQAPRRGPQALGGPQCTCQAAAASTEASKGTENGVQDSSSCTSSSRSSIAASQQSTSSQVDCQASTSQTNLESGPRGACIEVRVENVEVPAQKNVSDFTQRGRPLSFSRRVPRVWFDTRPPQHRGLLIKVVVVEREESPADMEKAIKEFWSTYVGSLAPEAVAAAAVVQPSLSKFSQHRAAVTTAADAEQFRRRQYRDADDALGGLTHGATAGSELQQCARQLKAAAKALGRSVGTALGVLSAYSGGKPRGFPGGQRKIGGLWRYPEDGEGGPQARSLARLVAFPSLGELPEECDSAGPPTPSAHSHMGPQRW